VKPCLFVALLILSSFFIACGGGSSSGTVPPPPATYSIGGTVSGLAGTGLVLQDNGGNNLPVAADGNFTFTTKLTAGAAYDVSVLTQPSSPAQTCTATGATGTANANVTTVQVSCANNVVTYTIGGSVSGLSGTGLVLQNNGGDNLTVVSNGAFTFATPIASGAAYAVSVLTQPSNPAQTCTVTNGSGTANANVTTVQVACTTTNTPQWTWVDGANVVNQSGSYGTKGTASPSNIPPPRNTATSWTDTSGNLWLFGGGSSTGVFNDLWKFSAGEWTWISGANTLDQQGVYGTLGTAAPGNVPGARAGAVSWIDASGNLWLFGGYDGNNNWFNDLWEYSAGEWTWMSGPNTPNIQGTYGTLGTAAPANIPGARWQAVSWIDKSGNFWLFGGKGYDSAGTFDDLNDLWKYSAGQWTWMSGSNLVDQQGTYGTKGTAAASSIPGARTSSVSWTDNSGNLWLFGGRGYDSAQQFAFLNDLWVYSASQWTWMAGDNIGSQNGIYGTLGVPAANNTPGSRYEALGWRDAAGNLWLFGGSGFDSASGGTLNDLWMYSSGEWTWMGGSNIVNQPGIYGTQGAADPANIPGSRWGTVGWSDPAGDFWLFGGFGLDSIGSPGSLNDLWEYQP